MIDVAACQDDDCCCVVLLFGLTLVLGGGSGLGLGGVALLLGAAASTHSQTD